jgi:hypothetical protein
VGLTRTWAGPVAQPLNGGPATMDYVVKGKTGRTHKVGSTYSRENGSWSLPQARPVMPGIVVYVRIDGGFSVWDPARNYWRTDPQRPAAYHFASQDVWDGLARLCSDVFDAYLAHCEARRLRDDMAAATVGSYRKILEGNTATGRASPLGRFHNLSRER